MRDGSSKDHKIEKGYFVTEMVGLTANKKQPVSLYSHLHSSHEEGYKSTNKVLFQGLNQVIDSLLEKATFVFDRGYDMNALFNFMYKRQQDFIIRLKKRKLFWKGKWFKAAVLRDSRKGKIKTSLTFREDVKQKKATVYISHLNIKITASKNPISLVLVYGLGKTPMMLATNKEIRSKEDVIQIVRSLTSINNLNQILTYAIGLLGLLADKLSTSKLSRLLIHNAKALRKDVQFYYYQLAEGILATLAYAREGDTGLVSNTK